MSILNGTLWLARFTLPAILALCAVSSWAAVSVTDVSVKANTGPGVIITYRLNEAATSVAIALSNSVNLTGGTAKGLNSVTYTGDPSGLSATITATAPAEAGTGGANLLVPVSLADPTATNVTGIDVNRRAASAYKGHIYIATGVSQAGRKKITCWASDGSLLITKDMAPIADVGSWPFGLAVAQEDPGDRVFVAQRSGNQRVHWLNPDLSYVAYVAGQFNYPGLCITPNTTGGVANENKVNYYLGHQTTGMWTATVDFTTNTGTAPVNNNVVQANLTAGAYTESIAVDRTNRVMYMARSAGANSVSPPENIIKFTSVDDGATWDRDDTWGTNLITALGAAATRIVWGVALDKGFDADDLANSKVWIATSPAAASAPGILYHVNASDGSIITADTIDLSAIAIPTGGIAIADKAARWLNCDAEGNIALTLGGTVATNGTHWCFLAPNTAGPTTDVETLASITPPLAIISASVDHPTVGNTGNATLKFTANVYDSAGIVADNTTVTIDLSQIGGPAALAATLGTVSPDGKSAPYTASYLVPMGATLGTFDMAINAVGGAKTAISRVTQTVYNAYVPLWTKTVDGAVNASSAGNGNVAYVGTDTGKVYAFNSDGTAVATFKGGGAATLPEPVKGQVVCAFGRLYVTGTSHMYALNAGTGALVATSASLGSPSSAAVSTDGTKVYVGAADNKIHALNAATLAEIFTSADLGAAAHDPEVGPTNSGLEITDLVVAGTEGDATGKNGKIVMLRGADLTEAYAPLTDTIGPVKSQAVFAEKSTGGDLFTIGGASGLFAVDADSGTALAWTAGSGGGGNLGGNPYLTGFPVDAYVAVARRSGVGTRLLCAQGNGSLLYLNSSVGERIGYGGYPAALTNPPGLGGIGAGSGVLTLAGLTRDVVPAATRFAYVGSDSVDKRFFGLEIFPENVAYQPTPARKHIYDPNDTTTFPGATAGAFANRPVLAGTTVVVGSTTGKVYGFDALTTPPAVVTSITPANGAYNVVANPAPEITIVFNQNIDPGTVLDTNFHLWSEGVAVSATVAVGGDASSVTITPNAPLTADKTYIVTVDDIVADATARYIGGKFTSTFFTGIPPVTIVKGDIDGDGVFNALDVKMALRIAAGLQTATAANLAAGDLYTPGSKVSDGKITLADAVFLDRVLNGKDTL